MRVQLDWLAASSRTIATALPLSLQYHLADVEQMSPADASGKAGVVNKSICQSQSHSSLSLKRILRGQLEGRKQVQAWSCSQVHMSLVRTERSVFVSYEKHALTRHASAF